VKRIPVREILFNPEGRRGTKTYSTGKRQITFSTALSLIALQTWKHGWHKEILGLKQVQREDRSGKKGKWKVELG
jgi:hypothetical protein